MNAKKLFKGISLALAASMTAGVWAMGGGVPPGSGTGLPDNVREILERLEPNPDVFTMTEAFKNARQAAVDDSGRVSLGEGIIMNEEYECTVFNVVTNGGQLPPTGFAEYEFEFFGTLFLNNLKYQEGFSRIPRYSQNSLAPGDLVGKEPNQPYYETIRVDDFGGLLVESATEEMTWIRLILTLLGIDREFEDSEEVREKMRERGILITSLLNQALGLVKSYSYCPTSPQSEAQLDYLLSSRK